MSDPTLVKYFADYRLRLSDSGRHERDDVKVKKLERFFHGLAGWIPPKKYQRKPINAFAAKIKVIADKLETYDDAELVKQFCTSMAEFKQQPEDTQTLCTVFACVGLGSKRTLGYWPHPVQFMGARTLLSGLLAEMQTGEGKTLVAGLAATVVAGSGAQVHVLSTNDYLAKRDEEEMRVLFSFFGISSGSVVSEMEVDERSEAYSHSICYVSGKEIVFDYLKDNLAGYGSQPSRTSYVERLIAGSSDTEQGISHEPIIPALHFCIVDEADSVLIDEARTPLIISKEAESIIEPAVLIWAIEQAAKLVEGMDFQVDYAQRDIEPKHVLLPKLTPPPEGVSKVWQAKAWQLLIMRQALMAIHLYIKDEHYIIHDDKIQIVDESTGRVMADRSWEQGLHQLIETKEGVELTSGRETMARMTFQRFFRRYFLLSGLTGTAAEVSRELWSVYNLKVCRIPPNRPNQRKELTTLCFDSATPKWQAVAKDALYASQQGQPVLVGTRSVEASESVAAAFDTLGVSYVMLNARQDADEAKIVSSAGQSGQITVATNMAGRGTDIKLTEASRQSGGLHVILTEYHDSARIDRQLIGRSGRQGDPGTVRAIVAFDDALLQNNTKRLVSVGKMLAVPLLKRWFLMVCLYVAQKATQRRSYRGRMQTLKQDRELNKQIGFAGKVS